MPRTATSLSFFGSMQMKKWFVYGTREVFLTSECVGGKTIVRIEVRRYDFGVWPVIVR